MSELAITLSWLMSLWAVGFACACSFYGLVLFFKQGLIDSGEVFDRACDGRWFRDCVFWPVHCVGYLVPLFILSAMLYPFVFTFRRLQTLHVRRYRRNH